MKEWSTVDRRLLDGYVYRTRVQVPLECASGQLL